MKIERLNTLETNDRFRTLASKRLGIFREDMGANSIVILERNGKLTKEQFESKVVRSDLMVEVL